MPTSFTGSPAQRRTLDTFIKLTRCTDSLMARIAERNTIGDLTFSQFAVLEALYHLGPMTAGEVGQKILKSGGNMTLVIDNLERDGLIRRERDANDRRVIRNTTGRPWGQTDEYAVRRSSSRMYRIFSSVSG